MTKEFTSTHHIITAVLLLSLLKKKKKKVKISNPYLISSQCHEVVVSSVFSIITLCSFLEIFVVHDFSTVLHNKLIPEQQLQLLIE